jgi:hypothetical protein
MTSLRHILTLIFPRLGERRDYKIMLLAGGDLIASFGHPGVWAPEDVRQLLFPLVKEFSQCISNMAYLRIINL